MQLRTALLCVLALMIGLGRRASWMIRVQSRLVRTEALVVRQIIPPVTHVPVKLDTLATPAKLPHAQAHHVRTRVRVQLKMVHLSVLVLMIGLD